MANKICHLCGAYYVDDPFLTEHPGHTHEQCLKILNWQCMELKEKLQHAEQSLKRAKKEYHKEV